MERNRSNTILGIVLIAAGALFLGGQVFRFNVWELSWPLYVLIPGLIMLAVATLGGDVRRAGLVIPGTVVTTTGGILAFANTFDRFEAWAYLWALYPLMVGFAMTWLGQRTGGQGTETSGRRLANSGFWMLVGFAAFFEGLIFNDFNFLGGFWWPLALVIGGLFLLFWRGGQPRTAPPAPTTKRKTDERDPVTGVPINLRRDMDDAIREDGPVGTV